MGVNLRQTSGLVLDAPADLAALLTNLEPRDVLFVDEIHCLSPMVEEILYPAMEDYPRFRPRSINRPLRLSRTCPKTPALSGCLHITRWRSVG